MQSVGTRLRDARIKKGFTLEEINARTRITLKNLTAIESDELSKISSPFAYRSFVRQVADTLALDYESLSPDVLAASTTMPEPLVPGQEEELPVRSPQYQQYKPKRKLSWVYRTASVAAILGAVSGYFLLRHGGIEAAKLPSNVLPASDRVKPAEHPEISAPAPAPRRVPATSNNVAAPPPAPKPVAQPVKRPAAASAAIIPGTEQLLSPAALVSNPPPSATVGQSLDQPPAVLPASTVVAPESEAIHIELSANEPTWLSIAADGKTAYAGVLDTLQVKILNGRQTARIRTGNAGAVSIIFNGRPLGLMGRRGQSRTFVFTKNGYEVIRGAESLDISRTGPIGE